MSNNNIILISGKSATGKSTSLANLVNPQGVLYLNCEANKALPFKSKFVEKTVTDPLQVYEGFEWAESQDKIHTVVVDSLTYLMDQFETQKVLPSSNTMKAWGEYAQFFKRLMQQHVAKSSKNVIFLAHTSDIYNESELITETRIKVKGSVMNQGVESYFTTVVSTKKVPLSKLKEYENALLTTNEEEEILGYKYVYQTKLTKDTVNETIKSATGMWKISETFIDNDAQKVLDRIHSYHNS
jgi:uncharacterized protein YbaA (DUF1428 family)